MIRFVLNMVFWGFLGLVALPSLVPASALPGETADTAPTGLETTIHAARLAGGMATEIGSLCTRQPSMCDSGRVLADAVLARARQGLSIASDMIANARAGSEQRPAPADA